MIISVFYFGITSLRAQTSNRYDWGIEGGPNLSTLFIHSQFSNIDPKPAIYGSGGFIFQYNFKNFLSIKTGFSYQRKGFQLSDLLFVNVPGSTVYGKGKFNSRMDYLTLPILVKASFGKKVRFFINAGPYAGYLLQKTDRTTINGSHTTQTDDFKYSDMNRWNFGVAAGVGITVPIGNS